MRRTYFITLCLCFWALLFSMRLSYSLAPNPHYEKLHYAAQDHKQLNDINSYYSRYIAYIVYPAAMQAYQPPNSYSIPMIDIDDRPIVPTDALNRLKKEMRMSPKVYGLLTAGYLRENFVEAENKDFSSVLTFLVSGFLQHEYYYKLIKARALVDAKDQNEWGFIAEWLEDERRLSHLYTHDSYFTLQIGMFRQYYGYIYSYRNNFLKTKLLLWLTQTHNWPVPTNKQIREGDVDIFLLTFLPRKKRKQVAYKMKVVQLLQDDKGFFARLFRFHLLNARCCAETLPSTATIKMRDSFFEGRPLLTKVLSCLSTIYWISLEEPSILDSTGSLSLDIFFAPILAIFTMAGLLLIIWSVNLFFLYYLFSILECLDENKLTIPPFQQKIPVVSVKKLFYTSENIFMLLALYAIAFMLLDLLIMM